MGARVYPAFLVQKKDGTDRGGLTARMIKKRLKPLKGHFAYKQLLKLDLLG